VKIREKEKEKEKEKVKLIYERAFTVIVQHYAGHSVQHFHLISSDCICICMV